MANRVNSVGFSFSRENLYWVILDEHDDEKIEVKEINKIPFEEPLDYSIFLSQSNRLKFLNALKNFKSPQEAEKLTVNLTIDSSICYLVKVPIEPTLELPELKDHLLWEFHQHFFDENPDNYYISYHPLFREGTNTFDSVILLLIKRHFIDMFRNIFENFGLKINLIDIDHFSAEISMKYSYPELFNANNFLMSIKDNFFEISFILRGNTYNYRQFLYESMDDILAFCEKDLRPMTNVLKNGIQKLFVWGDYIKPRLINELNSILPIEVITLDPFKNFIINKKVMNLPEFINTYEFVSACGIALRG